MGQLDPVIQIASEVMKFCDSSKSADRMASQREGQLRTSKIHKEWQDKTRAINPERYYAEVGLGDSNRRIDLLDTHKMVAYEFKVSAGNHADEFFRDLLKVAAYNEASPISDKPIKRLIFLTHKSSAEWLLAYFRRHVSKTMRDRLLDALGFEVAIRGIEP